MVIALLALGFGFASGLRSMMGLAAVSVGARAGFLKISGSWLAFLGYAWTPWILIAVAAAELINDKLPKTPSRKSPPQFVARTIAGGLSGAAIGTSGGSLVVGAVLGIAGAVVGTYAGASARASLVTAIGGRDLPIALTEDVIALLLAGLLTVLLNRNS